MKLRSLIAASGVLLLAPSVRAERPRDAATLTYLPSPTTGGVCPAAEFLELEVEIRLGYELFQRSAPNHLTVAVERVDTQFRAVGEMLDDAGNVVFTEAHFEPECTAAVVDMAIAVALELTRAPAESEASSSASSASRLTTASSSPTPAATLSPPPPLPLRPSPYRVQVGLASVFAFGKAPAIIGGLGWHFGVRSRYFEVAIEARSLVAPSADVEIFRARTGYRYLYASIAGFGCYHKWWMLTCARVEVGSLSVKNVNIEIKPNEVALFSAGFRFGAERILLPGLAFRIYADIYTEIIRTSFFRTEGPLATWDVPRISAAVGVGPVLSWGN